jgi:hypothetical protein
MGAPPKPLLENLEEEEVKEKLELAEEGAPPILHS